MVTKEGKVNSQDPEMEHLPELRQASERNFRILTAFIFAVAIMTILVMLKVPMWLNIIITSIPILIYSFNTAYLDFWAPTLSKKRNYFNSISGKLEKSPSLYAEGILFFLAPKEKREVILGDLIETYNTKIRPEFGAKKARIWFRFQAIRNILFLIKLRWSMLISFSKNLIEKIIK